MTLEYSLRSSHSLLQENKQNPVKSKMVKLKKISEGKNVVEGKGDKRKRCLESWCFLFFFF
jgi:hypothetical protein